MSYPEPAPAPVPPPAAPLAVAAPSQDDRLLAACAHLSFFTGMWLLAPIAIYVLKRKESRFVALQALQAALVQVLFGAVTVVVSIVALFVTALGMLLARSPELAVLLSALPVLAFAFGCLGLLTVHAVAAFRAWQGHAWQIPIAGRLARVIMDADEGAAKA